MGFSPILYPNKSDLVLSKWSGILPANLILIGFTFAVNSILDSSTFGSLVESHTEISFRRDDMSKIKSKQKPSIKSKRTVKRRRVTFSFESNQAKEVILLGDFNNWNPKTHPMKSDGNGSWNKTVIIPPGRYEYKFLVDGKWAEDPRNEQYSSNCFGTCNSVLNVTPK